MVNTQSPEFDKHRVGGNSQAGRHALSMREGGLVLSLTHLFVSGCARSLLPHGPLSGWGAWASPCSSLVVEQGLGARELWSLGLMALESRLCSVGPRLRGTWDLPGSGTKPAYPALRGRFFTTGPPRKPGKLILLDNQLGVCALGCKVGVYRPTSRELFMPSKVFQSHCNWDSWLQGEQ